MEKDQPSYDFALVQALYWDQVLTFYDTTINRFRMGSSTGTAMSTPGMSQAVELVRVGILLERAYAYANVLSFAAVDVESAKAVERARVL